MSESLSLHTMFTALRKQAVLFITICVLVPLLTYLATLLMDNLYKSSIIVFPTNNFLNDRNYYYKNNIQNLYSQYGGDEEIDQIIEIGSSENTLLKITDSLALYNHYSLNSIKDEKTLFKAAKVLKKRISFLRTKNNALEISVWDKDIATSKKILQLLLSQIHKQYAFLQQQKNLHELQLVENRIKIIKDELVKTENNTNYSAEINSVSKQAVLQQLNEVEKLRISILASPVTETAFYQANNMYTSLVIDKPNRMFIVLAGFLIAIIIATLVVSIKHANKSVA
jgi:uncharacterized protein YeaO (DUF488 family)